MKVLFCIYVQKTLVLKNIKQISRSTTQKREPIQTPIAFSRQETAPAIKRSLQLRPDWTLKCAGMRYQPKFWATHTEVRVNSVSLRQRLRLDFVAIVRWSMKKPKDVFGIEIKSCLSDFESDTKWINYLTHCDYFCIACPAHDAQLISAIEKSTLKSVGILIVDLNTLNVSVWRKPVKQQSGKTTGAIYETLYERVLGLSGSDKEVVVDSKIESK